MTNQQILRLNVYISGAFCILLGALVLLGWYCPSAFLLQVNAQFPLMHYNAAVCFILSGLAILFLDSHLSKFSLVFSIFLLLLAGLTLSEYIFNIDLAIDQLFFSVTDQANEQFQGRMSPNTALGFICAALSILFSMLSYFHFRSFLCLVTALITFSLGLISLLGYLTNLTTHFGIGQWVKMSIYSVLGLIVLSEALIALVFLKHSKKYISFRPLCATFAILIITFLSWQTIKENQQNYLNQFLQLKADDIKNVIAEYMQERIDSFSRITTHWLIYPNTTEQQWRADVLQNIKEQPGYMAIEKVDKSYHVRWVVPERGNEQIKGFNLYQDAHRRLEMFKAIRTKQTQMSNQIDLIQGGKGVLLFSPIFRGNQFDGFTIGVINIELLFNAILSKELTKNYVLKVYDDTDILYSRGQNHGIENVWYKSASLQLLDRKWKIIVQPSTKLYNDIMSFWPPYLTLVIGCLIAVLSGFLIRILELLQRGSEKLNATRTELANANGRLQGIIEGSSDYIAALDLKFNFIVFNNMYRSEVYRLFKVNLEVGMNFKVLLKLMSQENQTKSLALWLRAFQGNSFTVIESFKDKHIDNLDFEIHYSPIHDTEGQLIGASHIATNVSQRIQNEKKLTDSKMELEKLVVNLENQNNELVLLKEMIGFLQSSLSLNDAIEVIHSYAKKILKDASGVIYVATSNGADMVDKVLEWGSPGPHPTSFAKLDCWALLHNQTHQVLNPHDEVLCTHVSFSTKDPKPYVCLPLYAQGEILGLQYIELHENQSTNQRLLYLAQIMSEQTALSLFNIKLRDELKIQSTHDSLTGLYNRRFFEEYVQKEISNAERSSFGFAILILDVDFFKKVNDNYGHLVGDRVLSDIADTLHHNCMENDMVCRWGGEEFTLYLKESNVDTIKSRAESIRQAIEARTIEISTILFTPLTISIGVSIYPTDGDNLDQLIHEADEALYQAKKSGRNRVIIAGKGNP